MASLGHAAYFPEQRRPFFYAPPSYGASLATVRAGLADDGAVCGPRPKPAQRLAVRARPSAQPVPLCRPPKTTPPCPSPPSCCAEVIPPVEARGELVATASLDADVPWSWTVENADLRGRDLVSLQVEVPDGGTVVATIDSDPAWTQTWTGPVLVHLVLHLPGGGSESVHSQPVFDGAQFTARRSLVSLPSPAICCHRLSAPESCDALHLSSEVLGLTLEARVHEGHVSVVYARSAGTTAPVCSCFSGGKTSRYTTADKAGCKPGFPQFTGESETRPVLVLPQSEAVGSPLGSSPHESPVADSPGVVTPCSPECPCTPSSPACSASPSSPSSPAPPLPPPALLFEAPFLVEGLVTVQWPCPCRCPRIAWDIPSSSSLPLSLRYTLSREGTLLVGTNADGVVVLRAHLQPVSATAGSSSSVPVLYVWTVLVYAPLPLQADTIELQWAARCGEHVRYRQLTIDVVYDESVAAIRPSLSFSEPAASSSYRDAPSRPVLLLPLAGDLTVLQRAQSRLPFREPIQVTDVARLRCAFPDRLLAEDPPSCVLHYLGAFADMRGESPVQVRAIDRPEADVTMVSSEHGGVLTALGSDGAPLWALQSGCEAPVQRAFGEEAAYLMWSRRFVLNRPVSSFRNDMQVDTIYFRFRAVFSALQSDGGILSEMVADTVFHVCLHRY